MAILSTAAGGGHEPDGLTVCDRVAAGLRLLELAQHTVAAGRPVHPHVGGRGSPAVAAARRTLQRHREDLAALLAHQPPGGPPPALEAQAVADTCRAAMGEVTEHVYGAARDRGARELAGRAGLPYITQALAVLTDANRTEQDAGRYFDAMSAGLDLFDLAYAQVDRPVT